jgi:hypothetical protein
MHPNPTSIRNNRKPYALYLLIVLSCLVLITSFRYSKYFTQLQSLSRGYDHSYATTAGNANDNDNADSNDQSSLFNDINPHLQSWCPDAKCQNSPLCKPCNRRHLFIISTARSGSTTLLTMFNNLPNTRISGENHNTFGILSQIETNLLDHQPNLLKHPMDKPNGPFRHNTIPQQSLSCITQRLHYTMNPPPLDVQRGFTQHISKYLDTDKDMNVDMSMNMDMDISTTYDKYTILGFKTVRIHLFQKPGKAAKFLKRHFPCSKFIMNIQYNITHQYESYKNTFNGSLNLQKIERERERRKDQLRNSSGMNSTRNSTVTYNNTIISGSENNVENDIENDINNEEQQYNGPSKLELQDIRDFHIKVHNQLGKKYSKLIRFDQWKDDVNELNDVIDWLGYKHCSFNAIAHDNENGYDVDNSTIIDLGHHCHYPFAKERNSS